MAAAIRFALSPALAIQGVINYETSEGRKLFSSSTHKLDEELYDCKPDGLYQFLQSLNNRAQEFGWNDDVGGMLHIPIDPTDINSETNYLIDNYGMISLEEIRNFEITYISQTVRPAQDSYMMFKCLMNSVSKEGKNKILIWKDQYTINGLPSGNLLLKIIIRESHLDTQATTASIRKKLSDLDTYILTIGCDITRFNGYVRLMVDSLAARGETTQDLLTNLFKGYQAASDKVFVSYIGRKLEKYEEGEMMTSESLMQLGNNKYKLLKEGGLWNAPSDEEEKILALQTEVKKLKKNGQIATRKVNDKAPKGDKPKSKARVPQPEKPAWFSKEPKEEDLHKSKVWNNKTWWFCSDKTGGKCDGKYRIHKPTECEGKAHVFKIDKKRKPEGMTEERKLKLAKAYAATKEVSGDESN
jgi:hypothetical protein